MIPATTERVAVNTAGAVNDQILRKTRDQLWNCVNDGPESIERRLEQLDREWDVERVLEANAAIAVMVGLTLGKNLHRSFFAIPGIVAGFLFQHAVQGWCPPLGVLRRAGFRTQSEIERERYALKAIRGDFDQMNATSGRDRAPVEEALEAVNL